MSPLSVIEPIATCVAAVAACGVFLQIRQGERHLRFDVYRRVTEMMEATGPVRRRLRDAVSEDAPLKNWSDLQSDDVEAFKGLVQTYDELGLLVKHRAVPVAFVLDLYSRSVVEAWHRLGPAIEAESDERKQLGHRNKFAVLALASKAHRDESHPNQETFAINNSALIARWNSERSDWPWRVRRAIRRRLRMKP